MRRRFSFIPTLKEAPAEAQVASHRLMLRAGMIRQTASGIYTWLPLGLKVLKNIEVIIRNGMNAVGAQELLMPTIQPAELWQESGRYDSYGKEMLRIKDRHDRDMLYGPTNEEVMSDVVRHNLRSYRDLPLNLYHIQWKFRDEMRPRFGLMRGREFLMKDAYSFDVDYEGARRSYENMYNAYLAIFRGMGLTAVPVRADTGPIGGDLSHEFHILADTGESTVYYDKEWNTIQESGRVVTLEEVKDLYAAADDLHKPETCPIPASQVESRKGIEVGHIFYFGTKYSKPMNVCFTDANGVETFAEMGSYGIGVSRLVAAIIEACHDEQGIIWPESVAPYRITLMNLKVDDQTCTEAAESLYNAWQDKGISVLYDDRDERAGAKFADADLLGSPWQVIVAPKSLADGNVEIKHRASGNREVVSLANCLHRFAC
jgi:prolyl-tRNA synthetase